MAPEVLSEFHYTRACDIYSLGVVMFILLSGTMPFNKSNAGKILVRTLHIYISMYYLFFCLFIFLIYRIMFSYPLFTFLYFPSMVNFLSPRLTGSPLVNLVIKFPLYCFHSFISVFNFAPI